MAKYGGWSRYGGMSQYGGGFGWWHRAYYRMKGNGPRGLRPDSDDALMNRLLRADAALIAHGKVHAYRLFAELFPHKAAETLDDWEEMLDVVPALQASQTDRRNELLAIWRGNQGASLPELRKMLYPILNPTTAFFDDFGDSNVSSRWTETGNGTSTESSSVVQLDAPAATDCQLDGTNDNGQILRRRVHDISDGFTVTALIDTHSIGTNGAAGILLFQDFDNIVMLCVDDAGDVRIDKIESGVLTEDVDGYSIPLGAAPEYLEIEKSLDGTELTFRHGNDSSALSDLATITNPLQYTRDFGVFARNDATNQTTCDFDEIKLVHTTAENNVEILEALNADHIAAGGDGSGVFFGFVHRMPTDTGTYNIKNAQRLLDKAKQAHTVLLAGESDEFLCDDPYSLCDRDVLGQ